MDPERFVAPTLVRYPSTDGLEVPAFLYKPAQVRAGSRVPGGGALARGSRGAGAAALPPHRPGDARPRGGGAGPQRPGLGRLRQGVSRGRRRGEAGAGAEGHRRHAGLHRPAAGPRRLAGGGLRRKLRRLHGRWPRWPTTPSASGRRWTWWGSATSPPSSPTPRPTGGTSAGRSTGTSGTPRSGRCWSGSRP